MTVSLGGSEKSITGQYGGGKTTGEFGSIASNSPVQAVVFNNKKHYLVYLPRRILFK